MVPMGKYNPQAITLVLSTLSSNWWTTPSHYQC